MFISIALKFLRLVSVFWTLEDPQPTSEFYVACPCPDGLMQDETQEAYIILHRGARMRLILSCTGVLVVCKA
jgi:hypothetical protein